MFPDHHLNLQEWRAVIDEQEAARLCSEWGTGLWWQRELCVDGEFFGAMYRKLVPQGDKRGEVVLAIRRGDGAFWVHTKAFYPTGLYRLPTGGIGADELVFEALLREADEETGLELRVERLLGIVAYRLRYGKRDTRLASYVFLLEGEGRPQARDEHERITGFKSVDRQGLAEIAAGLEALPGGWRDWGRFRAIPHRLVLAALKG